jgi:hypothetical protein
MAAQRLRLRIIVLIIAIRALTIRDKGTMIRDKGTDTWDQGHLGRADHIGDEAELVVIIFAGEQRPSTNQLCEDAAHRPNVHWLAIPEKVVGLTHRYAKALH